MRQWSLRAEAMEHVSWLHLMWRRYLERGLKSHGVSMKQATLLRHADAHPGTTPSDVARLMFCDRPTATSLLATMTKRGWIRLAAHPHDGRSKVIELTAAGRRTLAALPTTASRDQPQEVDPLAPLSQNERQQLVRLLERMRRHLATIETDEDAHAAEVEDDDQRSGADRPIGRAR